MSDKGESLRARARAEVGGSPLQIAFAWRRVAHAEEPLTQSYIQAGGGAKNPDVVAQNMLGSVRVPRLIAWFRKELGMVDAERREEAADIASRQASLKRQAHRAAAKAEDYIDWGPRDFDRREAAAILASDASDADAGETLRRMLFMVRIKPPDELPEGAGYAIKSLKENPRTGGLEIAFHPPEAAEAGLAKINGWTAEDARQEAIAAALTEALAADLDALRRNLPGVLKEAGASVGAAEVVGWVAAAMGKTDD
jgi:hypothetical protein